jgi:predicted TIM-barrel fold metal-dependent hydrolase
MRETGPDCRPKPSEPTVSEAAQIERKGTPKAPDPKRANDTARRANDFLAQQVARRPDRFQALAALPMQDPGFATAEPTRCVKDLGFKW